MQFNHIILEKEQQDLFRQITEIVKSVPRNERMSIHLIQTAIDYNILIPSKKFSCSEIEEVSSGDIQSLINYGLLDYDKSCTSRSLLYITPIGFKYYEFLVSQIGDIVERIESHITNYLNLNAFEKKYPLTVNRIRAAEELLWKSDSMEKFTQIGHLCREAVQHFAEVLYRSNFGRDSSYPLNKTVIRLREIVEFKKENNSKSLTSFLDSLIVYWGELNDLVQKQEHGAEKELNEVLTWEESRRVLFQTLTLVYELDRSLS